MTTRVLQISIMKDANMNDERTTATQIPCPSCGDNLIRIEHYEYDGVTEHGSFEPWLECPNGDEVSEVIL